MTHIGYFSLSPEDGTALYLAAKQQGIRNQTELGKRLGSGFDQGKVSKKLSGKAGITLGQLNKIYELIGSPPELQPIIEKYSSIKYDVEPVHTEVNPVEESWRRLLDSYFGQIKVVFKNLPVPRKLEVISGLEKFLEDVKK